MKPFNDFYGYFADDYLLPNKLDRGIEIRKVQTAYNSRVLIKRVSILVKTACKGELKIIDGDKEELIVIEPKALIPLDLYLNMEMSAPVLRITTSNLPVNFTNLLGKGMCQCDESRRNQLLQVYGWDGFKTSNKTFGLQVDISASL